MKKIQVTLTDAEYELLDSLTNISGQTIEALAARLLMIQVRQERHSLMSHNAYAG